MGIIHSAVRRSIHRRVAGQLVLLCLPACANFLDLPDDPMLVADDANSCLASGAAKPDSDRALVRVRTCNFISSSCSEPVIGVTATLCNKRDVDCSEPIQDAIRDSLGEFTFQVPTGGVIGTGFDGYLRLSAPQGLCTDQALFGSASGATCSLVPACDRTKADDSCRIPIFTNSMLFFNPPIVRDTLNPVLVPLIPTAASFSLVAAADVNMADISTGFVFATIVDCNGAPVAGATVELMQGATASVRPIYLIAGIPNANANATDASGLGGLLGVPPGFRLVGAKRTGPHGIETGSVGVQVDSSTVTYVTIMLSAADAD